MRSWPSWVAIALGAPFLVAGLFLADEAGVPPLLLPGAILLAAGLHSLQASNDAWCDCAACAGGCECCGSGCVCGDCSSCSDTAAGAATQHSH